MREKFGLEKRFKVACIKSEGMSFANPCSRESEMRKWSFPIHFVGNEKLELSECSSDVPISFTQDQLPHFFRHGSIERGCPPFSPFLETVFLSFSSLSLAFFFILFDVNDFFIPCLVNSFLCFHLSFLFSVFSLQGWS